LSLPDISQRSARIAAVLREKRLLLLVDDVWQTEHFNAFRIGGNSCGMVATTRATSVANAISAMPSSVYRLDVLAFEVGMDLLKRIVPEALDAWPQETADLVRALEGLPLAIRVAGHLLKAEMSYGLDIHDLVSEIKETSKILESTAPADRLDPQSGTIPSVATLLEKSTARLDEAARRCFSLLGALTSEPAQFDLGVLGALWETDDPRPTVKRLVDLGLLEPIQRTGRYQMHSLLMQHARSLCSR
jgi:hypothetical protein